MGLLGLRDLKNEFIKALSELYPSEELDAIFRLAVEAIFDDTYINISLENDLSGHLHEIRELENAKQRLKDHEPIQHILGRAHFYDLEFEVNQSVLVPRQETELLVDLIIKKAKHIEKPKILDIGTGSGCIAISLKKNLSNSEVSSIDISKDAITVAKRNAIANSIPIDFIHGDILNWKELEIGIKYDIIVSNPPYVRRSEEKRMEKNVTLFDPELALYVDDNDPLIFYREISRFAKMNLAENGTLAFEINEAFGIETAGLVSSEGFSGTEVIKDLNGKDRIVIAVKS